MRSTLKTIALAGTLAAVAAALGGCFHKADPLAFNPNAPDEFRVVSKAPLVVPPDYALRPPSPGEPRPQELKPESAARLALLGEREKSERSAGESLFADRAGASKADPLIRYVMDDEFGSIAHKDRSFADRIMFWKKVAPAAAPNEAALAGAAPTPIDPVAEQAKIKSLTGGKDVVIARAPQKAKSKLPGL
jgi:Protein of unknown function (DUF3035)